MESILCQQSENEAWEKVHSTIWLLCRAWGRTSLNFCQYNMGSNHNYNVSAPVMNVIIINLLLYFLFMIN